MIAFQFRNLIQIKQLLDSGLSYGEIIKKTKLHPFVVKKSMESVRGYSIFDLKDIYKKLLDSDTKTKTTQVSPNIILDEFILSI